MPEVGTEAEWKENADLPPYLELRCYKFDREYEEPGTGGMKFSKNSSNRIFPEIAEMPEYPWKLKSQVHQKFKHHPLFSCFINILHFNKNIWPCV